MLVLVVIIIFQALWDFISFAKLEWHHLVKKCHTKTLAMRETWEDIVCRFVVIIVPADGLAQSGVRASASTMVSMFAFSIHTRLSMQDLNSTCAEFLSTFDMEMLLILLNSTRDITSPHITMPFKCCSPPPGKLFVILTLVFSFFSSTLCLISTWLQQCFLTRLSHLR